MEISDDNLAAVRALVATGVAVPAIIVAALIERLDRREGKLAKPSAEARGVEPAGR